MADLTVGYAADGTPKTYTTVAAAFSAASTGDNLQVYYSNASKNRVWRENVSNGTTKVVGIEGMLADRQVRFVRDDDFYYMTGDLSAAASQVTLKNFQIANASGATTTNHGIIWNDTTGGGQGVKVDGVIAIGYEAGFRKLNGDNNVVQFQNCLALYCDNGFQLGAGSLAYFCTAVGCQTRGLDGVNSACTIKDCAGAWNGTDFARIGSATVSYCASADATATGTGSMTGKTLDDFDFWGDEATARAEDYRIVEGSDLYHAGNPVSGISADCDGNARDGSTPSIGWHEGTAAAYEISATAPSAPEVSVARVDDTTARVTFSNSDPGVTNRVRYADIGDGGDNWSDGGSRSGDGTVDVSGLTLGQTYYLLGFSDSAGAYSEPSNVAIYAAGSASGATGAYARFISDLYDEVRNSAALAAKVTSGSPADHVKLGRFLNIDTDSKRHAALIANGPVVYLEPRPYSKAPRSGNHNRCEFSAVLQVFESYDASAADTLITTLNFVEALTREIMAESDGAGASWAACGCDVRVSIDGPREIVGLRDELVTSVSITANWTEEL